MPDASRFIAQPPAPKEADRLFAMLARLYPSHPLATDGSDPFQTLVATVLSSRTKDPTTNAAMERLWHRASTPQGLLAIPEDELAQIIFPVGFYKVKARHLHALSTVLLERFNGKVPETRDELMELPGVGRKVANLVLNICFNTAAICVDIHVHRITNRLGWLRTDDPFETEQALELIIAEKHWTTLNRVLVNHGQQVCQPVSPRCSICQISESCPRIGVVKPR